MAHACCNVHTQHVISANLTSTHLKINSNIQFFCKMKCVLLLRKFN